MADAKDDDLSGTTWRLPSKLIAVVQRRVEGKPDWWWCYLPALHGEYEFSVRAIRYGHQIEQEQR